MKFKFIIALFFLMSPALSNSETISSEKETIEQLLTDINKLNEKITSLKEQLMNGTVHVETAKNSESTKKLSTIKTNCSWHPIQTQGNYTCPARHFVNGVCLTNYGNGCFNEKGKGTSGVWVVAGAVQCCSID